MARLRLARELRISHKRLHGWEPRTVQRGYDRDGNRVALGDAWEIVTETEPEWDDEQRSLLRGLVEYEEKVCACGLHESVAHDKSNHFTFEDRRCPVCAGVARYMRIQSAADERHEKALGEDPPPAAARPTDGRTTYIRQMSAAEVEQRKARKGKAVTSG